MTNIIDDIQLFKKYIKLSILLSKIEFKIFQHQLSCFLTSDEVFTNIKLDNGLNEVDKLTLFDTQLSEGYILSLSKLGNLKRIDIIDEREHIRNTLEKLKSLRSDFNINFNDREINT